MHALCLELASADKNPHSRRLAGLILKNALDAKDEARKQQRIQQWLALDAAAKAQIKAGVCAPMTISIFRSILYADGSPLIAQVVKTLADPVKEARHTAAQVRSRTSTFIGFVSESTNAFASNFR